MLSFVLIVLTISLASPFPSQVATVSAASNKAKVKATVKNYFKAASKFNTKKMNSYVKNAGVTDPTELADYPSIASYLKKRNKSLQYTMKSVNVSGSKATVTVKCKYLDSTKTYNSFMTNFVFFILNNLDKNYSDKVLVKKLDKIFKETLKDSKSAFKMKYTTKTFKINLIKENGKWKIATVSKGLANAVTANFFKATESFFN